jgi:hypothetical protein
MDTILREMRKKSGLLADRDPTFHLGELILKQRQETSLRMDLRFRDKPRIPSK